MNFTIHPRIFVLFPLWLFYIFKHSIDMLKAVSYITNITTLQKASNI